MENCPNCGNEIRPTARFCTSCGFRMPERPTAATATAEGAQSLSAQASGWGVPATEPAPPPGDRAETLSEEKPSLADDPNPPANQWKAVETPPVRDEPPVVINEPDPVAEIEAVPPSGPIPDVVAENTINDMAENRVNIALFHIERLKQLVPDITGWSEQQAGSVDTAISALETAVKGREDAGDPYHALRETLKIAKRNPRDIDVMIALADRAGEIEDLLSAHDQYSLGVREALFAIKPAAVNYVAEAKKRPARKRPARRAAPKKTEPAADKATAPATDKEASSAGEEDAQR